MRVFLLFVWAPLALCAHPHFFIDTTLMIDANHIVHQWTFDKLNSKLLLFEFDTNHDNALSEMEQKALLDTHFYPLQSNHFNLILQKGDTDENIEPLHVNASVMDKRIVITFTTLFSLTQPSIVCTIDGTLYSAYSLQNVQSTFAIETQKSDYDFCLGVTP